MRVVAGMATFPDREFTSLGDTIRSLIDQVDVLHLYLNEYESKPKWLGRFDNIKLHLGTEHYGDLKDVGKFFGLSQEYGEFVYLAVDDDGLYPQDYASKMVESLDVFDRDVIVTGHLDVFKDFEKCGGKIGNFFKPLKRYSYEHGNKDFVFGHVPGTGTVAFKSDLLEVNELLKCNNEYIGACDILIARICQRDQIPIVCLPKPKGWLLDHKGNRGGKCIVRQARASRSNDFLINEIISTFGLKTYKCSMR